MHDYLLQIYPSCVSPQSTQGKERVESVVGEKSFLATRNTHSLSPDVFADWSMIPRPASPGSRALFKLAAMSAADRGSGARRLERQGPPPVPAARHRSSHQLARRWPLPVQLCVVVLFFVLSLPVRVSSSITCAHANSTCSDCAVLCGVAQFYPLLPSPCHPDFPTASYDIGSSSFSLSGAPLSSPDDLLPATLGDSFSVSARFNRTSANGTLVELETDSVRVSVALLNGVLQVVLGNDTPVVASTTSEDNVWNHIVVTLENTTTPSQDSLNISIYINGTLDGTPVISLGTFPASLQSVSIGDGYTGSLKDVGLYSPALNEADLEPTQADFIPQCLCYPGTISTTDPALCTGNTENNRYNETAHVVGFLFDNSSDTYWQSAEGETPVAVQLELASLTSLSKIFISFQSALPTFATLEYMLNSQWEPLQYWADDCTTRGINESASSLMEAICTSTGSSGTSLEFLIAAGGRLTDTSQEEDVFVSDQLRLVMDGLATGESHYAIREFEVCTTYCTDTSSTCDCTQATGTSSSTSTEVVSTSSHAPTSSVPLVLVTSSDTVENTLTTSQIVSPTPTAVSSTIPLTMESSSSVELSSTPTIPMSPSQTMIPGQVSSTVSFVQPSSSSESLTTSTTGTPAPSVSSSSEFLTTSATGTPTPSVSSSSESLTTSATGTPAISSSSESSTLLSSSFVGASPLPSPSSSSLELPAIQTSVVGPSTDATSTSADVGTLTMSSVPGSSTDSVGTSSAFVSQPTTSLAPLGLSSEAVSSTTVVVSSQTLQTSTSFESPSSSPSVSVIPSQSVFSTMSETTSSPTAVLVTSQPLEASTSSRFDLVSPTPVVETTSQIVSLPLSSTSSALSTPAASVSSQTPMSSSSIGVSITTVVPSPTSETATVQSSSTSGASSIVSSSDTNSFGTTSPSSSPSVSVIPSQRVFSTMSETTSSPTAVLATSQPLEASTSSRFDLVSPTPVVETTSQIVSLPSSSTSSALSTPTASVSSQTPMSSSSIGVSITTVVPSPTSETATVQSSSTSGASSIVSSSDTNSFGTTSPSSSPSVSVIPSQRVFSTMSETTSSPTAVLATSQPLEASTSSRFDLVSPTPVVETTSQIVSLPLSSTTSALSTPAASVSSQTPMSSSSIGVSITTVVPSPTSETATVQSSSTSGASSIVSSSDTNSFGTTSPSSSPSVSVIPSQRVFSTMSETTSSPTAVLATSQPLEASTSSRFDLVSPAPVVETTSQIVSLPLSSTSSTLSTPAASVSSQTPMSSSSIGVSITTVVPSPTSETATVQSSSTSSASSIVSSSDTNSFGTTSPSSSPSVSVIPSQRAFSTMSETTSSPTAVLATIEPLEASTSSRFDLVSPTPVVETTSQIVSLPLSSTTSALSTPAASVSSQTPMSSSSIGVSITTVVPSPTSETATVQSSSTSGASSIVSSSDTNSFGTTSLFVPSPTRTTAVAVESSSIGGTMSTSSPFMESSSDAGISSQTPAPSQTQSSSSSSMTSFEGVTIMSTPIISSSFTPVESSEVAVTITQEVSSTTAQSSGQSTVILPSSTLQVSTPSVSESLQMATSTEEVSLPLTSSSLLPGLTSTEIQEMSSSRTFSTTPQSPEPTTTMITPPSMTSIVLVSSTGFTSSTQSESVQISTTTEVVAPVETSTILISPTPATPLSSSLVEISQTESAVLTTSTSLSPSPTPVESSMSTMTSDRLTSFVVEITSSVAAPTSSTVVAPTLAFTTFQVSPTTTAGPSSLASSLSIPTLTSLPVGTAAASSTGAMFVLSSSFSASSEPVLRTTTALTSPGVESSITLSLVQTMSVESTAVVTTPTMTQVMPSSSVVVSMSMQESASASSLTQTSSIDVVETTTAVFLPSSTMLVQSSSSVVVAGPTSSLSESFQVPSPASSLFPFSPQPSSTFSGAFTSTSAVVLPSQSSFEVTPTELRPSTSSMLLEPTPTTQFPATTSSVVPALTPPPTQSGTMSTANSSTLIVMETPTSSFSVVVSSSVVPALTPSPTQSGTMSTAISSTLIVMETPTSSFGVVVSSSVVPALTPSPTQSGTMSTAISSTLIVMETPTSSFGVVVSSSDLTLETTSVAVESQSIMSTVPTPTTDLVFTVTSSVPVLTSVPLTTSELPSPTPNATETFVFQTSSMSAVVNMSSLDVTMQPSFEVSTIVSTPVAATTTGPVLTPTLTISSSPASLSTEFFVPPTTSIVGGVSSETVVFPSTSLIISTSVESFSTTVFSAPVLTLTPSASETAFPTTSLPGLTIQPSSTSDTASPSPTASPTFASSSLPLLTTTFAFMPSMTSAPTFTPSLTSFVVESSEISFIPTETVVIPSSTVATSLLLTTEIFPSTTVSPSPTTIETSSVFETPQPTSNTVVFMVSSTESILAPLSSSFPSSVFTSIQPTGSSSVSLSSSVFPTPSPSESFSVPFTDTTMFVASSSLLETLVTQLPTISLSSELVFPPSTSLQVTPTSSPVEPSTTFIFPMTSSILSAVVSSVSMLTLQSSTIAPFTTVSVTLSNPAIMVSSESSFVFFPSTITITPSEPVTSFVFMPSTFSVIGVTGLGSTPTFTPTPSSSIAVSTAPLTTAVPTVSSEVTLSLSTITGATLSISSSIELSFVPETTSVLQTTPGPTPSSFESSTIPTPSPSFQPPSMVSSTPIFFVSTTEVFPTFTTTLPPLVETSTPVFSMTQTTTVFSSTPLSPSPTLTVQTSSAVMTSLETSPTSSPVVLPFSTSFFVLPETSSVILPPTSTIPMLTTELSPSPTLSATPTPSLTSVAQGPETSFFSSSPVVVTSSPAILNISSSSMFFIEPTSTVVLPFSTSFFVLPETSSVILPPTSTIPMLTTELSPSPTLSATPTPSLTSVAQGPETSFFSSSPVVVTSSPAILNISSSSMFFIEPTSTVVLPFSTSFFVLPETSSVILPPTSTIPMLTTELSPSPTLSATPTPSLTSVAQGPETSFFSSSPVVVTSSPAILNISSSSMFFIEPTSTVVLPFSTSFFVLPETSSVILPPTSTIPMLTTELSPSPTLSATPTPSLTSVAQSTAGPETSFFSSSPVVVTSSPAILNISSSSMFFIEPTSTLVVLTSTLLLSTSMLMTSPISTQSPSLTPSPLIPQFVTTSVSLSVSVSITPTPTPQPSPISRLPPLALLTLAIDGLGSPLQARPTHLNDSDGLLYRADVGAYFAISGEEDMAGRVNVSFGDFSGTSKLYSQGPSSPVGIDVSLASDEVWPDSPRILLAVQVRDSLLTTRNLNQEVVRADVHHPQLNITTSGSCEPDYESGVCTVTLSLGRDWFTAGSDETVNITISYPLGSPTIKQVTLRSAIMEDASSSLSMELPAHPVLPGDRINIPIYARYEYLLSSFTLICSVREHASILEFTGPINWSLVQSFPTDGMRHKDGSVTGFRNYDAGNVTRTGFAPDHLTNLSVEIDSVSSEVEISVECEAVGLLLTTKDVPDLNIPANATDRVSVRIGRGLLFARPNSIVKFFAHSTTNQLTNIAYLTREPQHVNLSVQAFHFNGTLTPVTENLTCSSQDRAIMKVEDHCHHVFFNGTETTSGETNITVTGDSGSTGYIPFRVWLPTNTYIDIENDTLNKIDTEMCSGNYSLYQTTYVHVVTTLVSSNKPPIESVYITSKILPHLNTSRDFITIDRTSGEIVATGDGEAEIFMEIGTIDPRPVTVNDATPVRVLYLDVFIFSGIQVTLNNGNGTPTAVEITILQDFEYVNSEVKVVGVAVFSDGRRQVLDPETATIYPTLAGTLQQRRHDQYLVTRQVNEVGFEVRWSPMMGCSIAEYQNTIYFNSSTPQSLQVTVDSSTVAHSQDPASIAGTPDSANLTVILMYEDRKEVDVTLNNNTQIQFPEDLVTIVNGKIRANGLMVNGTANITVNFETLHRGTLITVVKGVGLDVLAHPFPPFEGSGSISIEAIRKIGSSYQEVEIEARVIYSNSEEQTVPFTSNVSLPGNVLILPMDAPPSVIIRVEFRNLNGILNLTVDNTDPLGVQDISNLVFTPSGLNQYQIGFDVTLEGGIYQNSISTSEYPNLFDFASSAPNSINIAGNGSMEIVSNLNQFIEVCVTSETNSSVSICENFTANLQPESGEIDLGVETGLPLAPVAVGDELIVPVFLSLNSSTLGIFEMEVAFDQDKLEFRDLTQGSDWETGQIVYVHPASSENYVSFGGILHAGVQGLRLHLANITFQSTGEGVAEFSANVSFIAMNDVDATLLETERARQISESSRISVEISGRRRRDADEPPIPAPPVQGHGIGRLRRQAGASDCEPNSVVGDTNGDCVVDLRDVYRLQLYVAESVFNFTSPIGQQLQQAINETTLNQLDFDGDGTISLSDILELEIVTLNLAYEAELNATVDYNSTINKCTVKILGYIKSVSGQLPTAEVKIHVVIGFISREREFADVFDNMTFTTPNISKSDLYQGSYYGGNVKMILNPKETDFRLDGAVESLSASFNVSVAVVVTNDEAEAEILSFSSGINDFEEATALIELEGYPLVEIPGQVPSGMCVPPSTSSVSMQSTSSLIAPSPTPSSSASPPLVSSSSLSSSVSTQIPLTTQSSAAQTSATSNIDSTTPAVSVQSSSSPPSPPPVGTTSQIQPSPTPTATPASQPSTSASRSSSAPSTSTSSSAPTTSTSSSAPSPSTSSSAPTTSTSSSVPSPSTSSSAPTTSTSSSVPSPSTSSSAPSLSTSSSAPSLSASRSSSAQPSITTSEPSTTRTIRSSSTTKDQTPTDVTEPSSTTVSTTPSTTTTTTTDQPSSVSTPTGKEASVGVVETSKMPTTSGAVQPTEDQEVTTGGQSVAGIVGAVLGVVISLLVITVIALALGTIGILKRKKGHYLVDQTNGVHIRRNSMISNGSSNYWRDTENGIEMSPRHTNIDIVPLEHYGSMVETNIDVVANHCVIMSEDPFGSTSLKGLIHHGGSPERGPPKKGSGPAPMGSKPHQTASYMDTGTLRTGATSMAGYTSSSMERSTDYDEDEDEGQLVLPDYDASQAYLSLGLTPLSQLSPDAHTSGDFGYFPSMPPPVAPSTSSIFSTSSSSLAMDNPFSLHSGGGHSNGIIDSSMMPDAIPDRRSRKSKYDAQPLSQGFPLRLEPVMEQSPPNSEFSGKQNGFSSSGDSSQGSPSISVGQPSHMLFPSAVPSQEFSRLSQGRTALRVKRPGAKGSRENLNAISPKRTSAQGGGYGSLGSSRHMGRYKPTLSPKKTKRRSPRELNQQEDQGWGRGQRMYSRDSPDYSLANGFNHHKATNGHGSPPLRDETHFDSMEMMVKRPSSRSRRSSATSNGSTSETEEAPPNKWTPRHAHHSSLDDSPVRSHRAERSESPRLYTTYEHR